MPLSWNEIRDRSVAFVRDWEGESSEHAEAKSFWDAFFQVFGVSRRRLAAFEKHVKKADGADGFIDLFWPGMLLAEHKSRGKNLDSAYDQATDYFPGLKDKELPRYIIVSDFARFRVRNLDTGDDIEFPLSDLPKNLSLFGFIAGYETRKYKEQDPVNVKAAEKLAELHDALNEVGYEGHELEVYLVRILFCLFADDTGIFMPRSAFEDFIRVRTSEDGSDLAPRLNQIFQTLNTPPEKRLKNLDEQIAALPYVNGQLFAEQLPQASFDRAMRETLLGCCEMDWGAISPAIFGSLFQGIMDAEVRRNLGAHYTSEKNIQKVIGPLFMDQLWAEFERIKTQKGKLEVFHDKLASLSFFDPACGCGNFLVISYRELRLLELEVIKRLRGSDQQQLSMDVVSQYVKVDVDQFHGIEIEEWPAQIARVAMWLIDHQMNLLVGETFGQAIVRIPLVKSANVVHGNALETRWGSVLPPERCNYILGNPPFVGKKEQTKEQKAEVQRTFRGVKGAGVLDFVCCWYVLAATYTESHPDIRCALVSTNSITQGEQVGVLWAELYRRGLKIDFAHRTFQWSNEAKGRAAVHCVIIGFSRAPSEHKLIFDYDHVRGDPHSIQAARINPYLVDGPEVTLTNRRSPLSSEAPPMNYGSMPIDKGNLILDSETYERVAKDNPEISKFLRRYYGGAEFIRGIERYCVWLEGVVPGAISSDGFLKGRLEANRRYRLSSNRKQTKNLSSTPGLFGEIRQPKSKYLLIPKVSSESRDYIPIGFMEPSEIASGSCLVVPKATLFHFGVMTSSTHMAWVRFVCGRMKSDYQYSAGIVYNNFPWPVDATDKARTAISNAAQGVLDARAQYPDSTLAELYNPLSMPSELVKAHQRLDRAVNAAYVPSEGKRTWPTEAERVAFLFELHQKLTSLLPVEKSKKRRRKAG